MRRALIELLGGHLHEWQHYTRRSRVKVYYLRKCDGCGAEQIQHAGPWGDGKWHPLSEGFRHSWEVKDFMQSAIDEEKQ